MDVGGWLRSLGLGQYEQNFRDNRIDADVLPQLTADDLRDIGVAAVGDRRRLLSAIAALAGATPSAGFPASRQAPAPAKKAVELAAERRPVTVMFCDLVGSTGLAARMDAEDWRNLVGAYLDAASEAVTGLSGHVLKRLGDGLMALFGYPAAQENDSERAVRAALAIQRALSELNARNARTGAPELAARIGLESGPVVVDATGEVFGEAPNVAARVQAAADPGTVLVTMNVQRQTAGLFVAEDLGDRELRGVSEPIQLFRIVRASGAGRRGGARSLTPFIGREEELTLLARRWERARKGEGQLVLIVGEPGLGKSRLIEEFRARLAETPHSWVEWSASQLLQNTPLHPIAEWGRLRFGGADAPPKQRLADLEETLRLVGLDPAEHAPLLAPLVDIPLPPGRATSLAPEDMRRRQLAAILSWLMAGARAQPIVLAFEDLQWADPTSIDILRTLAERGGQAPLFVIATSRPEFRPSWGMRSHHGVVSLSPLDRAQAIQMVGEIASRHALPKDVIEGVSERTGGVPLFVEEVTRLLVERGAQGGAQAIPPTLQQSLAARLDRLGEAREVAQIGAVLGREFSYGLLKAVAAVARASEGTPVSRRATDRDSPPPPRSSAVPLRRLAGEDTPNGAASLLPRIAGEGDRPKGGGGGAPGLSEPALQSALERLAEADLVFVEGHAPDSTYRFKHALIQDAAYESLLRSRRQAIHRRAAEALRDNPERAAAEPEAIAHHFTRAGLDDAAIEWWGRAGDQALRRSAFQEAIAHLGKAIAMADKDAPDSPNAGVTSQRVKLHSDFGKALMWSKGFAAKETDDEFARVRGLLSRAENDDQLFVAYDAQCLRCFVRAEHRLGREIAETFLREAEQRGRVMEIHAAQRMLGIFLLFLGELGAARTSLESALEDSASSLESRNRFGRDTATSATTYLSVAVWLSGEVERARTLLNQATQNALRLGHVASIANAYLYTALVEVFRGDANAASRLCNRLLDLGQKHSLGPFVAAAEALSCWVDGRLHDPLVGANRLREALNAVSNQGMKIFFPLMFGLRADLEAASIKRAESLILIDEGLRLADQTGEHWTDAFLHQLRGDVVLKSVPSDPGAAEKAYQTAIAIAKQQGARSYELLASLSLAKLYQSSARPAEAHAVLAPALEGFAPTPEMPEIAEAQALLAALAETEEVKAASAQRERRLQLQMSYGQAMMMGKGFAAEETKAAFARASELAAKADDFAERFEACHGQWTLALVRGEQRRARELASAFLKEAEDSGRAVEVGVARRSLALSCLFSGDFLEARTHCERALDACDPERDRETRKRFWDDTGTLAMSCLAATSWQLGEVERARELIDSANCRAKELGHPPSMAHPLFWKSYLELLRGDAAAALSAAEALERLSREHEMPSWRLTAELNLGWARGRLYDAAAGAEELRRALAVLADRGGIGDVWFWNVLLAELEAETLGADIALTHIDDALALAGAGQNRCDLPFPHRLRGELLLRRDPSNPAPAADAFRTALAIARQQGARSWGLRAALSLARLYQSTARPADAHAVLAPASVGFAPTPEMPEIAEAEALLAALAESDEVKAEATQRRRLTQLQVAYGNALVAARGYGATETTEAFAKAGQSASGEKDASERLAADWGLWAGSYVRGDLPSMRAHAAAFMHDVEARPDSPEAGVAHRAAGETCWFAGEYAQARDHLERALVLFQPGRDDDLAFRFGVDPGVNAMAYLAIASWALGEVDRAISLIDRMQTRIAALTHAGTLALGRMHAAMFELMRGDHARAAQNASELVRLTREYDLNLWGAFAVFLQGLEAAHAGAPADGLEDMRRGVDLLREQNVLMFDGLLKIVLAEAEARAGDCDHAVAILDEALATCDRLGFRAFEADLHRVRGEILLKRDAASSAPAEEAFLTAIAVAKQQGTRSFELRAALSLAKLYRSTGRPAEAHAVLSPGLEGFPALSLPLPGLDPGTGRRVGDEGPPASDEGLEAVTPDPSPKRGDGAHAEMPELAEAAALLAALSQTDEVKAQAAQRQRLTHLQVAYGNALIAARGYGAPETTQAFARARESASGDKHAPERLAADYGLWVGSYVRGDLPSARAHAAAFLGDIAARPDSPEAGVAHRVFGTTCWFAGEYRDARNHLERALALFQPGRDDDLAFRFGLDPGVGAMGFLAKVTWPLGEVDRSVSLVDRMQTRMAGVAHVGTLAFGKIHAALSELMRGDHARAAPNAFELARLAREHDLPLFRTLGMFLQGWATAASGAVGGGLEDMRRGAELLREQDVLIFDGLLKIALAEAEARAGDPDRAVSILDEALATCARTGHRAFEPELHRARGELLLKRDTANPAPAEEAFQTAIAVAKRQGTRTFELRAAHALAKLYCSTGRPFDAHAVLAPALEGFAPTPEMPEIAEAAALLAALAQMDAVKAHAARHERLLHLQVAYGAALIAARGFGAQETTEAFARARESARGDKNAPGRLAAEYGLWASSYVRGELSAMRAHSEAFLSDLEAAPDSPEAGVAHRAAGVTFWFGGEYREALKHLERALALFQPGRDDDLAFRFGVDPGVAVMSNLAFAVWPLGEVERATSLVESSQARLASVTHAASLAFGRQHSGLFALMRRDRLRAALEASELARLSHEYDLKLWRPFGVFLQGWAAARSDVPGEGLYDMRRGVDELREQNVQLFDGLLKIALAEAEARAGDPARGIVILDEALETHDRMGYRAFEAELHRARGDILLMGDPSNLALADEALLSAVAVARRQGARSLELRAALSLAKLYQSTGRPADAHAVLAPALVGFAPTPEMPEIAEAQALLAALAETDEVKAEAARRGRRTQLELNMATALLQGRGMQAPETRAAFQRAGDIAAAAADPMDGLAILYGQWAGELARGDVRRMLEIAASMEPLAAREPSGQGALIERRVLGLSQFFAGDLIGADQNMQWAAGRYDFDRDHGLAVRFAHDQGAASRYYLAFAKWLLGDMDAAWRLIGEAKSLAERVGHPPTSVAAYAIAAWLDCVRGDHARARANAETAVAIAREFDLPLWRANAEFDLAWARAGADGTRAAWDEAEAALTVLSGHGAGLSEPSAAYVAEGYAALGDFDRPLALVDQALSGPVERGLRVFLPEAHRVRGEIMLNRDPADPALAEEAFRTAIDVAREQGSRAFGLRAALSLAKLHHSTGRSVDAHAVLAPALEGFAPTPEMPEIAEAQALLAVLARATA